ncbi:signal peptidase II [Bifidobacterium leontopitheci]|uniref:Lipoprotein signal peptidase n=1 Tax=Bifidobacterium leontopitheci TaxID=2650774 RepID=A0A6I1GFV1_9BIFI|nr:signal peptidase II [Bifidobacterium leontopitheci]KAB7790520.1 lipoprotein signal peptidase [Bifidobacterium leontopitheci]
MASLQGRLRTRAAVFASMAVVALIIDQGTKYLALTALGDGRTVEVIPRLLSLTLVRNPGASLGFGSGSTWMITLLAIVACIVMIVLAARTISMRWTATLALAFAGAFGNLIDRVAYADGFLNGKVVDFLDYGWSVGNVADIYLVVAGVVFVVLILCGVPFGEKDLQAASSEVGASASPAAAASADAQDSDKLAGAGEHAR